MAPFQKLLAFLCFSLDKAQIFGIIDRAVAAAFYMQWYRSGHNEHDWKSCSRDERLEGSNPSYSAIIHRNFDRIAVDFFYFRKLLEIRFSGYFGT